MLKGRTPIEVHCGRVPRRTLELSFWAGVCLRDATRHDIDVDMVERHCAELAQTVDDLHEELHKALPKPGSRGVVVIRRADNSPAHACNAENINGKIWLFEAHDGVAVPIGKLSTGESHQPRGVVGVQGFYRLESVRKSKCYDLIITNAG